jgi:hypothetical protein
VVEMGLVLVGSIWRYELVKGDLGTDGIEHEPPCIAKDSGCSDVSADDHVAEEQPSTHKRFIPAARRSSHDIMVWRIKRQCRRRQPI